MSTPKTPDWTSEPWHACPSGSKMALEYSQPFTVHQYNEPNLIAGVFGDVRGGEATAKANSERIVQCVNACAGLSDPAEAIRETVEALRTMLTLHECADETGYVTDVGFIDTDKATAEACRVLEMWGKR